MCWLYIQTRAVLGICLGCVRLLSPLQGRAESWCDQICTVVFEHLSILLLKCKGHLSLLGSICIPPGSPLFSLKTAKGHSHAFTSICSSFKGRRMQGESSAQRWTHNEHSQNELTVSQGEDSVFHGPLRTVGLTWWSCGTSFCQNDKCYWILHITSGAAFASWLFRRE